MQGKHNEKDGHPAEVVRTELCQRGMRQGEDPPGAPLSARQHCMRSGR